MYLSPEDRAIGRENFNAAIGSDVKDSQGVSRRGFLKRAIAAGIAARGGLARYCFGYGEVGKPVRLGIIGTGDQGSVLIGGLGPKSHEVAAICDIRPYSLYRAFHGDAYSDVALKYRPGLVTKYGWKSEDEARRHVRVYGDYRELLADPKIEAVIVALPLHLHAPVAVAAMRAGKHVFVEKLMAKTVSECKEMARVAAQTGRCLAVGYQRHYNLLYTQAANLLKQGTLGKVHYLRVQWHRGNLPGRDSWQQPLPPGTKDDDPRADYLVHRLASWKRALARSDGHRAETLQKRIAQTEAQIADRAVDAARHGYVGKQITDAGGRVVYECPPLEELIRWRLWDRTSGGLMSELGSHQLSGAGILLSGACGGRMPRPLRVYASAARAVFPHERDVADHVYCTFDFPAEGYDPKAGPRDRKVIGLQQSVINGNGFGGYGETVYGTEGTLIIEREKEAMLFRGYSTAEKLALVAGPDGPGLRPQPEGDPVSAAVGAMATVEASRGYAEELEHWAWCIRNPDPANRPRCDAEVGLATAVLALAASQAARTGRPIEFRPEWFDPRSDETPEGVKPNPTDERPNAPS